ncbi:hypothetical protein niasHT_005035 [Heterodera trifolii]|uniref:Uncharacterized protein n=1 Tax=Heterodera trifolii TaxID=157864 RepID=A0ABD2MFR4_9BILA
MKHHHRQTNSWNVNNRSYYLRPNCLMKILQKKNRHQIPTHTYENELTGEESPKPHTKISESDPQTLLKKAILTTECSWKETVELSGNSTDLTQWIEYVMKAE